MGGKQNKCCCDGDCPAGACLEEGLSSCAIESAIRYIAYEYPAVTADRCCEEAFEFAGSFESETGGMTQTGAGSCTWEAEASCGTFSLTIISATEAVLTLTLYPSGKTIVWNSVPSEYDPLCISKFVYSAEDSDPPDDCNWPLAMCVEGTNLCLDCCDRITGFWMTVTAWGDNTCECSEMNRTVFLPWDSTTPETGCVFSIEVADTVECPLGDSSEFAPGYYTVQLGCLEDGYQLTARTGVVPSVTDIAEVTLTFPFGTACDEFVMVDELNQDPIVPGPSDLCDNRNVTITITPVII